MCLKMVVLRMGDFNIMLRICKLMRDIYLKTQVGSVARRSFVLRQGTDRYWRVLSSISMGDTIF